MLDIPTVKAMMNIVPYTDWSEYNFNPTDIVCKSTQVVVHMTGRQIKKMIQLLDLSSMLLRLNTSIPPILVMRVGNC